VEGGAAMATLAPASDRARAKARAAA
jgi:hypothetical protein